jgi:hypothetical protein
LEIRPILASGGTQQELAAPTGIQKKASADASFSVDFAPEGAKRLGSSFGTHRPAIHRRTSQREETNMTNICRICTVFVLGLAISPMMSAQQRDRDRAKDSIEGTWEVSVTVKNCQTGALIRIVRSLQMFIGDGSFTETANTAARGSSLGAWRHTEAQNYDDKFWFFRYKPDGTFASLAKGVDHITVNSDGNEFDSYGTVQDFDANNMLISTGCVTHTAKRLTDSEELPSDPR